MHMHYRHPEDCDKRCYCPRCGWSGTLHQADEFTPASGESFQVCPKCAPEVPVIPELATQYLIKSERGWWLPKGYGYTQDRALAGRFTLADMEAFNLDGCTLYKAES